MTNCYEVLGVGGTADEGELKRAYLRLAAQYHPDRNPGPGAVERFLAICDAYETLSDPERRRLHDQQLAARAQARKPELSRSAERALRHNVARQGPFARGRVGVGIKIH